jgi:hypothetical protein
VRTESRAHRQLGDAAWRFERFVTERGELVRYAVVLMAEVEGERQPVRLFDNAHGTHDMHRYTRDGIKLPAEIFHFGPASAAKSAAIREIEENWRQMVEPWLREI